MYNISVVKQGSETHVFVDNVLHSILRGDQSEAIIPIVGNSNDGVFDAVCQSGKLTREYIERRTSDITDDIKDFIHLQSNGVSLTEANYQHNNRLVAAMTTAIPCICTKLSLSLKIQAIKHLRETCAENGYLIGLKEAKEFVDAIAIERNKLLQ